MYVPFKHTGKSEWLTIYTGACISTSLQIPKSRVFSVSTYHSQLLQTHGFSENGLLVLFLSATVT